jgi:FMN-dependent dehydrogenase
MNPADLLKLFGTEAPWMVSLVLFFLASVLVDPRRPWVGVRDARSSVDALIISNRGGRQLDEAAPSVVMLPGMVETVYARASRRYLHGDLSPTRVRGG